MYLKIHAVNYSDYDQLSSLHEFFCPAMKSCSFVRPSFLDNEFHFIFDLWILLGQVLKNRKGKGFYGRRFTRRGNVTQANIHDLTMKFFGDIYVLKKTDRISLYR